MTIITIDPTGTNITGIFLYLGGLLYDFATYQSEKWTWHYNYLSSLIKDKKPVLVVYEDNIRIKTSRGFINNHYRDLLKMVGGIELLCEQEKIPYKVIYSSFTRYANEEAERGEIGGLTRDKVKRTGPGAKKKRWMFKGKLLTDHEKDALLLFWIYWIKMEKKSWPWVS